MGFSQSGYGQPAGSNVPAGLILLGVVVFAVILALGARHDATRPAPEPTPSASATR